MPNQGKSRELFGPIASRRVLFPTDSVTLTQVKQTRETCSSFASFPPGRDRDPARKPAF